jgi:hypothetical protein
VPEVSVDALDWAKNISHPDAPVPLAERLLQPVVRERLVVEREDVNPAG